MRRKPRPSRRPQLRVPSGRVRISLAWPDVTGNEEKYLLECVRTNWITWRGRFVDLFERRFAKFVQARYAVSCSSGTSALDIALAALEIGPGDDVIVPSLTYVATVNAVHHVGARPVFADSDGTWNLDAADVERKRTRRTRAVIPVHLYGHPCDMNTLRKLARRHGWAVVEDAAEGLGTLYRGRHVGAIGDVGIFSFFANKTITTGEGGMVVTNNKSLADVARRLTRQGHITGSFYEFDRVGYNYRLTNLQAAIGCAQMERVRTFVRRKAEIARAYRKGLRGVPGLELPPDEPWGRNSYWMFSILVRPEYGMSRDRLIRELWKRGIETRPFFSPVHRLPMYRRRGGAGDCPRADSLAERGLNLPSATQLSDGDIGYVCRVLRKLGCSK